MSHLCNPEIRLVTELSKWDTLETGTLDRNILATSLIETH